MRCVAAFMITLHLLAALPVYAGWVWGGESFSVGSLRWMTRVMLIAVVIRRVISCIRTLTYNWPSPVVTVSDHLTHWTTNRVTHLLFPRMDPPRQSCRIGPIGLLEGVKVSKLELILIFIRVSFVCIHSFCNCCLGFCVLACFGFISVRLHVMQRTVLLSQFCLSVRRPSVCLSDACIVTKPNGTLRMLIQHERAITLAF